MNKIIVNRGSFKLDEVAFEQGTVTVGRAAGNTIRLDDNAVSSHHAKIVTVFHTSYIEDLDSTNGTLLNGKNVQKRTLHSGDVISLGNHQLLFQSDEEEKRSSDVSQTLLLKGNEIKERLSEFMQAQADQINNPPGTDNDAVTLEDTPPTGRSAQSPAPALNKNQQTQVKRATPSPASLEKNQAWLDAGNKPAPAHTPKITPVGKSTANATAKPHTAVAPPAVAE